MLTPKSTRSNWGSKSIGTPRADSIRTQGKNDWYSRYLDDEKLSPEECLKKVQEKVEEDRDALWQRGTVGELLLHWVALHVPDGGGVQGGAEGLPAKAAIILQWLVASQSVEYLNEVYDQRGEDGRGHYDGEGLLHLCVIKRDKITLEKMLQKEGVRLDRRAHGSFFDPGANCYFGEYVTSFAVATDWLEGLELIKAYVESEFWPSSGPSFSRLLELEDSWGNGALHIAVLFKRERIYTWLRKHGRKDAINEKNSLGFTAISLAAFLNDRKMFDVVLRDMCETKWKWGHVTCSSLPLEQFETVEPANVRGPSTESAGPDGLGRSHRRFRSVIEVILMQRCENVVTNPEILEILMWKWKTFGQWMFAGSFAVQVGYLLSLYWLAREYHAAETKTTLLGTLEFLTLVFTLVCWAGMILDIVAGSLVLKRKLALVDTETKELTKPEDRMSDPEWEDMKSKCRGMFGRPTQRDVIPVSVYDCLSWCGQVFITIHVVLYALEPTGKSDVGTAMLSIGIILVWQSSMQMCLAWKHFGTLVIIIIRVAQKDLPSFFLFLFISLAGFSQGLSLLDIPNVSNDFGDFAQGLLTMFRMLLGEKPSWTKNPTIESMGAMGWVGASYYVVFCASAVIVLLRLMISMFNETYAGVRKKAEEEWRLQWGQMILRTELRLRLLVPVRYHHCMSIGGEHCTEEDDMSFSHVFKRVDEAKFDVEKVDGKVAATALPKEPAAGESGAAAAPLLQELREMRALMEGLRSSVDTLRGDVDAMRGGGGRTESRDLQLQLQISACERPECPECHGAGARAAEAPGRAPGGVQPLGAHVSARPQEPVVDLPGTASSREAAVAVW